jgi:type I restriction enzyme R subunit
VAGSIYEACKFYELFAKSELKGKCAIVTSYAPSVADTKGETTGAGETDNLIKYAVYARMLADWFDEPVEPRRVDKRSASTLAHVDGGCAALIHPTHSSMAIGKVEKFEQAVKKKFIDEPGQMKLLIVVDKLLTGFDAPSATYLYIDKQMRDHGLFQAICRVNRLDCDSKEYGYIIDYKDLFKSLEGAVGDYTSGALDGYDKDDVKGLLENRLVKAREDLEDAREAVKALCEPVAAPREPVDYFHYFCARDSGNAEQLKDNEPKRLKLYKFVAALIRAYAGIANELAEAGYTSGEIEKIKAEVDHASKVRDEVRINSEDYIDLKAYEPAMRHLIDTYIRAEESEKISAFDDLSLIQLIVERGPDAVNALPKGIRKSEEAVAETIENNVRKLIINESPVDPAYYDKMSKLLDALIELRRKGVVSYKEYLEKIARLTRDATLPGGGPGGYPDSLKSAAQRALYNNLGKDEGLALAVDAAIRASRQDGWRENSMKTKRVRQAVKVVLAPANDSRAPRAEQGMARDAYALDTLADRVVELARHQSEY